MSWLGGSISSFTGQLTNLTKDILTEGTEEVSDHATELRIAQDKIKEFQAVVASQSQEIERLKRLNHEVEEKAEASELQINSISREYRTLLEEKEKQINDLKQLQHETIQHSLKPSSFDDDGSNETSLTGSYHRAETPSGGYDGLQFSGDNLDFSDNINMQHEINRLTQEIKKLKAESKHWKTLALDRSVNETAQKKLDSSSDVLDLQNKVKELQEQINSNKEQHQHEIASLQDVHSQKLSALRKKIKTDAAEYKEKIAELENQVQSGESSFDSEQELTLELTKLQAQLQSMEQVKNQVEDENKDLKESVESMKAEIDALKVERSDQISQIESLTLEVQHYKTETEKKDEEVLILQKKYEQVCSGLDTTKYQLLDQLDANHAQSLELLGDIQEVRRQMGDEVIKRRDKLLQEKQDLVIQIFQSSQKQQNLKTSLGELEKEYERTSTETDEIVKNLGDSEHQKLTGDIMDTFEKENVILKKKNVELQEQNVLLERAIHTITEERQTCEQKITNLQKQVIDLQGKSTPTSKPEEDVESQSDLQTVTSDLSELSRQNEELDRQVTILNDQISKYEQEINQFEIVKSDWQNEKEALEDVLMQLREQLREKEMSLNVVEAQKGLMEVERQGKKGKGQKSKGQTKSSATGEKGLLELERHDYAHSDRSNDSDSDDTIDSVSGDIGDDIKKLDHKVDLLTQANAQLENERDILLKEKANMEKELLSMQETQKSDDSSGTHQLQKELKDKDDCIATLALEKEGLEIEIRKFHDIQQKLMEKDTLIADLQQEKDDLESGLEELDSQHQEAMDQLIKMRDSLNKKAEELSHQLDEKDENIRTLSEEITELKQKIPNESEMKSKHSEEHDQELSNLKGKISEVENQNKELKTTAMKLKEDLEKRDSDLKDLKEKLHKGAIAVNEMHMEKQDMESELGKCKEQISEKVQKVKEMREKNSELEKVISDLNQRIESLERSKESLEHQLNSQGNNEKVEVEQLQKELNESVTVNESANKQVADLETKLQTSGEMYDQVCQENTQLKSELSNLREQFIGDKDQYEKQLNDLNDEFEVRIDMLKSEKSELQKDLNQSEQNLENKVKHYENYIQELQNSQEMDTTSIQQEHQRLMQVSHEKDLKITQLETELSTLKGYLEDSEENLQTSLNKQKDLKTFISDKDEEIKTLKNSVSSLTEEIDLHVRKIQEQESRLENLQEIQTSLSDIQDENSSLKSEIDELNRSLQDSNERDELKSKSLELLPNLEIELKRSAEKVEELNNSVKEYQKRLKDQESIVNELNQQLAEQTKKVTEKSEKLESQEDAIALLQQNTHEKDQEITSLKNKLHRATSLIDTSKQKFLDESEDIHPNFDLNTVEKCAIELKEVEIEGVKRIEANLLGSENKTVREKNEELERELSVENDENIVHEMEKLQSLLQEKDNVITELQNNNKSLLKMLDSKSKSILGDKTLVDVHQLENEVSSLKLEREQIMAVMNEKSRECSNLKSEVHRLMNIISAEKVALEKLQKDNHELTQKRENSMDEMQREALQNLSRLVRDKDLEIDALTQKNQTLLLMLQETSSGGTEVTGLMQDKDNLSKQLTALQNEREQLVACLNQKHQESLAYHGEIQRLTAFIKVETEKFEETSNNYENLMRQFEDKKQTLLKTQNELINYKQKYTELEIKYGELLQQSNVTESVDITSYNTKLEEVKRLQEKQKEFFDNNKEKEMKIQSLHQQNIEYEEMLANKDMELSTQKKQIDNLTFQLQGLQTEVTDLKNEHLSNDQQVSEKLSQIHMMKDANDRLTLTLQEREFELKSLKEKVETLTVVVQDKEGEKGSVDKLMKENETIMLQAKQIQQERDQAMMAIKQRLVDNEDLSREIQKLKEKENKSSRELDRLRNHLIQIEEGYTKEALDAEEREKELRNRLVVAEEKIMSSSTAAESASMNASVQVESLQQQLYAVAGQRDQAYLQYSTLQDQCQQYASSLANLQLVLEQFQQEKEFQVAAEVEHYQKEAATLREDVIKLHKELEETKVKLDDAEDGLEAAQRLSEKLDKREEAISALKEEVLLREKSLKEAEEKLKTFITSQDNKVDKLVIKNLFLGYFTTPKGQKHQVLVTIGGVLNFSPEDFERVEGKAGLVGWVPGFLKFGPKPATPSTPYFTPPQTPVSAGRAIPQVDKSFSELFVKFLENESTPPPPAVRLPAEEMARDVQRQRETNKPAYNPFTAPRHVAMPLKIGEQETSHSPHILMSSAPLSPTMSMFAPTPVSAVDSSPASSGRSTPNTSSAILKDVLGSR